jgi:hypothetical protein
MSKGTKKSSLAFGCHAEHGEKVDSRGKVVDHDADIVASLDRCVASIRRGRERWSGPTGSVA